MPRHGAARLVLAAVMAPVAAGAAGARRLKGAREFR